MKMKKITNVFVLSLATLVCVSACNPNNKNSSGIGDVMIADYINVIDIETAVVGQTLNLDDYISVIGSHDGLEYKAELLTDDTATLNGKDLTITNEGSVTIYLEAAIDDSVTQVLSFEAISQIKDLYKQYTNDITTNFFLGTTYTSNTGAEYLQEDGWIFTDKYYAVPNGYFYEDDNSYQGYIYTDQAAYQFSMDDKYGTNAAIQPGLFSSIYYTYETFELTYDRFETVLSNTGEYYLVGDEELTREFCRYISFNADAFAMMLEENNAMQNQYTFVYKGINLLVRMHEETKADGSGSVCFPKYTLTFSYEAYDNATGNLLDSMTEAFDTYYLRKESAFYEVEALETLSLNPVAPVVAPTNLYERVEAINTAKNYTLDVDAGWYDASGNKTGLPAFAPGSGWDQVIPALMFDIDNTSYVTETEVVHKMNDTGAYIHLQEETGKVYETVNFTVDADDQIIVGDAQEREEVTDKTTLWDKSFGLVDSLALIDSEAKNNINIIYQGAGLAADDYDYVLSGTGKGYLYLAKIMGLDGFYGTGLATNFSQSMFVGLEASGFECLLINCYITLLENNGLELEFGFGWDANHTFYLTYTFSGIGSTTIPTLA